MKKLHLLCNAHLDPVWQWRWQEGVGTAITTFSAAADFCEEFENYIFCHNEAVLYQWVEENDPALFARIQKLVAAGKWHIMGGWYLQPDCNMPAGESFIRQMQAGLDYFKEKFPSMQKPQVAINFDSFGHTRGLVQILRDAGYKGYVCLRPEKGEGDRLELWHGYAGSQIPVYRVYGAYNTLLGQVDKKLEPFLVKFGDTEEGMFLWGVGNHGGGPSRQDYRIIEELKKKYPQTEMVHSTPEAYFAAMEKHIPDLPDAGDLNYLDEGCYTSMVRVKQMHQKLENELARAEKMILHAQLNGANVDSAPLKSAEEDLMFCEFHDILPGSCIREGEEDALVRLSHGISEADRLTMKAFFALSAGQKKAAQGEYPILVYNPHPFPVRRTVECEFMLADQNWSLEEFYDVELTCNGEKLPCQLEKESSSLPLDWRKRVVFTLDMKPFSMNRVSVFTRLKPVAEKKSGDVCKDFTFDNGRLRACVSAKTGLIKTLSVDGKEYLKNSFSLRVGEGFSDPWGFFYNTNKKEAGRFELLDEAESAAFAGVKRESLCPVRVIEDGEVRTVVEALFGYRSDRAAVRYTFPKEGTAVQVHIDLFNQEKDIKLRLNLKSALVSPEYTGRTAFGMNPLKTNGDEVVAQDYTVLHDEEGAISAIHFGTYGTSSQKGEMNFTLLNSAAYCAHPIDDRVFLASDRYGARIDRGERQYDFEFNFGETEEVFARIEAESQVAHQQPYAIAYFPTGNGKPCGAFAKISNPSVAITALRRAKNGKDVLVRVFNSRNKTVKATVTLAYNKSKNGVTLLPYQFKSFLVSPEGEWKECNCLEEA